MYVIRQQVYASASYARIIARGDGAPPKKGLPDTPDGMISAHEKERVKIMRYKQSLYQDWKDGDLTHGDYLLMYEDYEQKLGGHRLGY